MNKILKILSILVIGFVMFSCSTPTNDPTLYVPEESGPETPVETPSDDPVEETPEEPSGPETPVETPSDDPVEETPEEPTYSITFVPADENSKPIADTLNKNSNFKNKKVNSEVQFPECIYVETKEWSAEVQVRYYYKKATGCYDSNNDRIKSTLMDSDKIIAVECF